MVDRRKSAVKPKPSSRTGTRRPVGRPVGEVHAIRRRADVLKLLATFVDPFVAAVADVVADVQQTPIFSVAAVADV